MDRGSIFREHQWDLLMDWTVGQGGGGREREIEDDSGFWLEQPGEWCHVTSWRRLGKENV